MRAWVFIIAALAIASCGGGKAPVQGNNAPIAEEKPSEPPPEWFELKELAASIHDEFPDLVRWEDQLAARKQVKDGTKRFREIGAELKEWIGADQDDPDWKKLRAYGLRGFRLLYEREPEGSAIDQALATSERLKEAMLELGEYGYIAHYDMHNDEGITPSAEATTILQMVVFRIELLSASGQFKQAEQELSAWVDVVKKCDRDSTIGARLTYNSLVETALFVAVDGGLRSNIGGPRQHDELMRLREADSSGFWAMQRGELAWVADWIGDLEFDSETTRLEGMPVEGMELENLRANIESLRTQIAMVKAMGSLSLDPTESGVYAEIKQAYERLEGEFMWSLDLAARRQINNNAAWLAYDLARMDEESPLLARTEAAVERAHACPAVAIEVDAENRTLALKIDPNHAVFKDLTEWDRRPIIEFRLREPAPEEEKQPD